MIFEWLQTAFMGFVQAYRDRVQADSGTVVKPDLTQDAILFFKRNNLYDSIKFGWMAGAGSKKRVSTIYSYFTKLYSFFPTNDATQTTEASQPSVTGNIAPGDVEALQNQNGEVRYLTHPAISFADAEPYSITLVFNDNGSKGITERWFGNLTGGTQLQATTVNRTLTFVGESTFATIGSLGHNIFGKISIITFTIHSSRLISLYKNGVFVANNTIANSSAIFNSILRADSSNTPSGELKSYFIRNIALTASEVALEANFLRQKFPEIPSVQIGSQTWALRNLDMVATPQGNLIANVTENANVEKITGGNFEAGLIGTLTSGDEISTWAINTTNPISGSQDGILAVTSAGTFNSIPRIATSVLSIPANVYVKVSFNYKVNSGTLIIKQIYKGGGLAEDVTETLSGTGTYTKNVLNNGTNFYSLNFNGTYTFNVQIDNLSIMQVGWSGSQDLYARLIAQGTSAANAAIAAGFWAFHTNSTDNGSWAGKLYNGYARTLLKTDLLAGSFGWHIATEAELTALAASGGYALRKEGTSYWTTTGGTNTTGLSLLGSAKRNTDGTFATLKNTSSIWCGDSDNVLVLNHDDNTATIVAADLREGHAIRLVKD